MRLPHQWQLWTSDNVQEAQLFVKPCDRFQRLTRDALFASENIQNSKNYTLPITLSCSNMLTDFIKFTSRASVIMHPITAQIRRVPSVSSLFNDDFTWSMGTSQAPTAGVAVLRRFSCLWRQMKRKECSQAAAMRIFWCCYEPQSNRWGTDAK